METKNKKSESPLLPLLLSAACLAAFLPLYVAPVEGAAAAAAAAAAASPTTRSICDTCACSPPDSRTPVAVNCTCAKTKLLIFRDQDAAVLSGVRDLTLAGCGFVSLPAAGLTGSTALARVTVRDMKLFHYTAGLFPALESLSVEDVGELVLDGFGSSDRTLRSLTLRRTAVLRLVKGTVTGASPLRRVLFDRVDIDDVETGALDMAFVGGGGADANTDPDADGGFTVINSTVKSVQTGGVSVRSAALRILDSALDDLAAAAIAADDAVVLSGNRFGAMAGDSVTVAGTGPAVLVDGNRFRALPADLQPFRSERAVEFRDNAVDNVDLGPFLLGAGPAVRATGNRFACDCDPRRVSVLKLDQVFPGLLPDADGGGRFGRLLADNGCAEPAGTTLAGYQDLLIKEIACKGANVTAAPTPSPAKDAATNDGGNDAAAASASAVARATAAFAVTVAALLHRA